MKLISFENWRAEALKNPKFAKAYKDLEPEFEVISAVIAKRIKYGITQKELARRVGTKQPVISRLEQGTLNPSIKFLKRVAKALNSELHIQIK